MRTNGAGKSTLLSITAGLLTPDRGSVQVDGVDTRTSLGRSLLGVAPEIPEMVEGLCADDLLVHVGIMRGLSRQEARERAQKAGVSRSR